MFSEGHAGAENNSNGYPNPSNVFVNVSSKLVIYIYMYVHLRGYHYRRSMSPLRTQTRWQCKDLNREPRRSAVLDDGGGREKPNRNDDNVCCPCGARTTSSVDKKKKNTSVELRLSVFFFPQSFRTDRTDVRTIGLGQGHAVVAPKARWFFFFLLIIVPVEIRKNKPVRFCLPRGKCAEKIINKKTDRIVLLSILKKFLYAPLDVVLGISIVAFALKHF